MKKILILLILAFSFISCIKSEVKREINQDEVKELLTSHLWYGNTKEIDYPNGNHYAENLNSTVEFSSDGTYVKDGYQGHWQLLNTYDDKIKIYVEYMVNNHLAQREYNVSILTKNYLQFSFVFDNINYTYFYQKEPR